MKTLLRGVLIFLLMVVSLAAYSFFYLFPSLKDISRLRREAADLGRDIKQMTRVSGRFAPWSGDEEKMLRDLGKKVRDSLFIGVKSGKAAELRQAIEGILQVCGRQYRLFGLTLASISDFSPGENGFEGEEKSRLKAYAIDLTFSADAKAAFGFLRCISSVGFRLRLGALEIIPKAGSLFWSARMITHSRPASFDGIVGTRFPLDADSPLLWQPLLLSLPKVEASAMGLECSVDFFRGSVQHAIAESTEKSRVEKKK